MVVYNEDTQMEDDSNMRDCRGIRADLKICLLETDCCAKVRFPNHRNIII